jgi:hypothetical protein
MNQNAPDLLGRQRSRATFTKGGNRQTDRRNCHDDVTNQTKE